jgi:hypothetical protein
MDQGQLAETRQRVVKSHGTLLPRIINLDDLDIHVDVEEIDQKSLESIGSLADFVAGHASGIE